MTCSSCSGRAHVRGAPCSACYGTGEADADPVAPAVVASRLSLRAEAWAQYCTIDCFRESALCRLAQVETLYRAGLEASTRDIAALRGVSFAIASGLDLEPYVGAMAGMVSDRGLHLILAEVRASADVIVERAIREVVRA